MEDDWDLHAVVRSCSTTASSSSTAAATTATTTNTDNIYSGKRFSDFEQDCNFSTTWFQDLFEPKRESFIEELHDLWKPFFPNHPQKQIGLISTPSLPISPLSVLGGFQDLSSEEQQQQQQVQLLPQETLFHQKNQLFSVSKPSASHNPRSKKRKNIMKRVCHVSAESLSSDKWSWRKYGQKPIKGSPYPRGYYRCSTSKGCMARKQVERNRSDPGMFIITYTSEHNHPMPTHRNSLAGSTRHKPNPDDTKQSSEKLESSREELAEVEDEDDDDDFSASKMALDDGLFVGLEDFTGSDNLELPWLAESTTPTGAAAAGGG